MYAIRSYYGEFAEGVALGVILLVIAFVVNACVTVVRRMGAGQ